ncbi:MAG: hypothetical protein A3G20_05550 [Acidobacteria bacterium RIFCSPLOWO2_12_FULL_59_11]|nr:MAG: hypothetical protein A3G20_05550 [Acidobacteria bacterium RIFCSPLOWO2_12_FULL_59_11]
MGVFAQLHPFGDWGLLALRLAVGIIFLVHGLQKLPMWKMSPSAQMSERMLFIVRFLSITESLGAVAVMTGFLTQLASAGLAIIMVGAIWLKALVMKESFTNAKEHKAGWEFALILLAASLGLFFLGAGNFALDRVLFGI